MAQHHPLKHRVMLGRKLQEKNKRTRLKTLLKKLLGIKDLLVTGFDIEDGALVIDVRPSWRKPRCSCCKKRRGRYDTLKSRC